MFVDRPDYYKEKEAAQVGQNGVGSGDASVTADSAGSGSEAKPAFIYLAKNRHGPSGKDPVWWLPSKTLFYEYTGKEPVETSETYTMSYEGGAETDESNEEDVQEEDKFFC